MLFKQSSVKNQAVRESQRNFSQKETAKDIDLSPKEISFMMQFGNYYPGFSPEWELFR